MKINLLALAIISLVSLLFYKAYINTNTFAVDQNFETLKEISLLKKEYSKNPNYDLAISIGNKLLNVGSYTESESYFLKAKSIDGSRIEAYLRLAFLYRYQNIFEKSEKEFNSALKISSADSSIYADLGKLYRNWHRYDMALKTFNKAIAINPNDDQIYGYGLGYLYRDMGDLKTAEKYFLKAFSLNPNAFNYAALGDLYREQKKFSESEDAFKKALQIEPVDYNLLEGLGWLYLDAKKYDQAASVFKEYLEKVRPKSEIYFGLAQALYAENKLKDAEIASRRSISLNGRNLKLYDLMARIYQSENKNQFVWATEVRKKFLSDNRMF